MKTLLAVSLLVALGLFCPMVAADAQGYSANFGRGEWNQDDWVLVKSPRWDYIGSWVQKDGHIENLVPEGAAPDRLIPSPHAYMSMVLREPFRTDKTLEVTARMEFGFDQGPQIVIADQLGEDENGYPEYRDHFEVVLFARGINIWHHVHRDGKPSWANVAFARFPLEKDTPYDLKVRILRPRQRRGGPATGRMIEVSVDGKHVFAYHEPSLPETVHVGIIAYASVNRFHSFSARNP